MPFLERLTGKHIFDPTVFVISRGALGGALAAGDRHHGAALVLTVLATIYPALRGAATEPAEALRYE